METIPHKGVKMTINEEFTTTIVKWIDKDGNEAMEIEVEGIFDKVDEKLARVLWDCEDPLTMEELGRYHVDDYIDFIMSETKYTITLSYE